MPTLFTKIIKREIPAKIVYENDHVLAFEDIHPQAPHHVLIIPKIEIPTLNDLNRENAGYIAEMALAAKEIATNLGVAEKGYRLVINCNDHGGQTVFHLHMHLLGGRGMQWPPG